MTLSRRTLLKMGLGLPPFIYGLGHHAALAGSPAGAELSAERRAELMEDARTAWQYFEQPGRHLAGLVPANIWEADGGIGSYRIVTMWDVGSILLATVSARTLGIIDEASYTSRMRSLGRFLARANFKYQGANLPNFRSDIDTGRSVEAGYDATDTARLFVALHVVDGQGSPPFNIRDLVRGWNLDKTVVDGQIHSIKRRRMEPAEFYVYRYYVSRAYGLWGVKHAPVTTVASPLSSAEARDAFLKEVGGIGPIATEPSLSEEVEIGSSDHSRVIADTLHAAQVKRYEETGKLTAVTESPIDEEPWFTYQGYDVARQGEAAWTVYSWKTDDRWSTPAFATRFRMVSSKAAFLWYATHPSEYTQKLWKHVRTGARARRYGFFSGIYETSGKAQRSIDVNTNATILAAVAYAVRGGQPLVSHAETAGAAGGRL